MKPRLIARTHDQEFLDEIVSQLRYGRETLRKILNVLEGKATADEASDED